VAKGFIGMKKLRILSLLPVFLVFQCQAQSPSKVYTFKNGDWEGSGKWYMGREIAPVMSHFAIGWLEREEREEEENVSQLLKNMALKEGEVVADIGAGSGYHVVRMAPMVGNSGKVMAVDLQSEMLVFLQKQADKLKLSNVIPVLGSEKSTRLNKGTVDKVLMVDVYHEFSFPKEMGESIFEAVKPGGLVYLIEYRAEDPMVPIKTVHKMTEKQAIAEMKAVGFRFVKNMDNLPWQHCLIFSKPE
jgi:ubiquinone/menaquinone biosynthesis C-methylase UbiE